MIRIHSAVTRREFLRLSGLAAAPFLLAGCMPGPSEPSAPGSPRLTARPRTPTGSVEEGSTIIGRDAILYVPASRAARSSLLVALHGAGADAQSTVSAFASLADEVGFSLLAMDSALQTWDAVMGSYGMDIAAMDRALEFTFDRLPVDAGRVFLAGFSDGASYALGVGLSNGDLFRNVLAFSPGFIPSLTPMGMPAVFIAHGTQDTVLAIDATSRRIVPALRDRGYDVEYEEFAGGHVIVRSIAFQQLSELVAR